MRIKALNRTWNSEFQNDRCSVNRCPYGAVLAFADRFAAGKIRVSDACQHCGHCTAKCSSNVQVHTEVARWSIRGA